MEPFLDAEASDRWFHDFIVDGVKTMPMPCSLRREPARCSRLNSVIRRRVGK